MKLSIVNVSKSYGSTKALSDFSLKIESGAVFGLIGSNGAGKSTLMKIVATLITPTSGYCLFEDTDIQKDPNAIRKILGFLLQCIQGYTRSLILLSGASYT